MGEPRQFFTAQARAAGAARRREKAAIKAAHADCLEVFVTRSGIRYGWDIRRFGGLTIEASAETFDDPKSARTAGQLALRAHPASAPRTRETDIMSGSGHEET